MPWLSRLCGMQRLPLRRRLRRMWWLRRWLGIMRSVMRSHRLLCIVGPLSLVLGGGVS